MPYISYAISVLFKVISTVTRAVRVEGKEKWTIILTLTNCSSYAMGIVLYKIKNLTAHQKDLKRIG